MNHFRQYFDKIILPGIFANFCSNNSDGRIWAFYFTHLTLDRDNPGIGLIHFVRNYYCSAKMDFIFSLAPYISYLNLISIML